MPYKDPKEFHVLLLLESSLSQFPLLLSTLVYNPPKLLFLNDAESAYEVVKHSLVEVSYDCVLVGAGVRTVPEHFIVFERLINAVHEFAPKAKICFNTNPKDTAEAVQRWI